MKFARMDYDDQIKPSRLFVPENDRVIRFLFAHSSLPFHSSAHSFSIVLHYLFTSRLLSLLRAQFLPIDGNRCFPIISPNMTITMLVFVQIKISREDLVSTWARGSGSEVREIFLGSSNRRVPIDEKGKIEGKIRVSIFNGTTHRKIILEGNDFSSNHDGMDECVGNLDPLTRNWILRIGVGGGGNEAGIEVTAKISGIHTLIFSISPLYFPFPVLLFSQFDSLFSVRSLSLPDIRIRLHNIPGEFPIGSRWYNFSHRCIHFRHCQVISHF